MSYVDVEYGSGGGSKQTLNRTFNIVATSDMVLGMRLHQFPTNMFDGDVKIKSLSTTGSVVGGLFFKKDGEETMIADPFQVGTTQIITSDTLAQYDMLAINAYTPSTQGSFTYQIEAEIKSQDN